MIAALGPGLFADSLAHVLVQHVAENFPKAEIQEHAEAPVERLPGR